MGRGCRAALPHCRAIANSADAERLGWTIVCVLGDVGTDDALQLWVDILAGKARVHATIGVPALTTNLEKPSVRRFLAGHEVFRGAIRQLRKAEHAYERGQYLWVVREFGWERESKAVREMLEDIDPGIRKNAAATLESLTGEKVAVVGSTMVFRGKTLWQVPKWYVIYGIRSHPDLPGELLVVDLEGAYVRHARDHEKVRVRKLQGARSMRFKSHGVLFPDANGKRAAVFTGASPNSEPVVGRFDEDGRLVWRAFLSDAAGGLAMAETKRHGRLFFVTTEAAKLIVFDGEGALRLEAALPNPQKQTSLHTYGIAAGEHAPGQVSVVVGLLSGWYRFPIRD